LALVATNCSRGEEPLPDVGRLQSSPVLRHLKKNPIASAPTTPAEQTVSQFYVPEGFRVDLVLRNRISINPSLSRSTSADVSGSPKRTVYPTKRAPGEGQDKIVIFEDKTCGAESGMCVNFCRGMKAVPARRQPHP